MKILTFTVYYLISINILALVQKGALITKKVDMMAELNYKVIDDFIGLVSSMHVIICQIYFA